LQYQAGHRDHVTGDEGVLVKGQIKRTSGRAPSGALDDRYTNACVQSEITRVAVCIRSNVIANVIGGSLCEVGAVNGSGKCRWGQRQRAEQRAGFGSLYRGRGRPGVNSQFPTITECGDCINSGDCRSV